MGFDPKGVVAVSFDSFSTLVDVDSTAPAVQDLVDDPVVFARAWHERAARYGTIANHLDAYATYFDLHVDALAYLLADRGIDRPREDLVERTRVYHDMTPFSDVCPCLDALAQAGYRLGVISNGEPALLESLVRVTGTEGVWDALVSAHDLNRHKPARVLYEHAARRLDTDPTGVVHVSNGVVDVQGAMHAGMQGVWINRQDRPAEPFGPNPDHTIDRLDELTRLLARAST